MSKFNGLWDYVQSNGSAQIKLTFDEIREIAGVEIDHSFLNCKKRIASIWPSGRKNFVERKNGHVYQDGLDP